ncbi:LptF/LptG family permease [Candidatus Pelagibacter sp.]|nr:LptF/LptG family permease [Candidatus Pelagibacter sp.]
MILSIYTKYIITKFLKSLCVVTLIFSIIILIMNLFEEVSFFKDTEDSILIPVFLTIINLPSLLFEILPFIFLITAIYFFNNLIEIEEMKTFKVFGITNLKLVKILSYTSFALGLFVITIFYSISTNLKFAYLDIKNQYSKDDKYLAAITANGLWIRDIYKNKIKFINAEEIDGNYLLNISISEFNENFIIEKSINAKKANIKNNNWILMSVIINSNNKLEKLDSLEFETNFNIDKILSLFDNLSALSLFELESLKKEYELLGYSSNKINNYQHKIYSYPIYLTLMVMIGTILMLNIGYNKSKIYHIILGILISVIIYYINYFFNTVIETQEVPYIVSVWGPQLMILLIITINLVRLNEK